MKILIVDDSEMLLSEEYNLLVTDINMPKMDGYELIRNMKEQGIVIPTIIISTEDEFKSNLIEVEQGKDIHLVKPTDPEKLIKTIKMLLQD